MIGKSLRIDESLSVHTAIQTKWHLSAIAVKPPTLGGGYKATHTL